MENKFDALNNNLKEVFKKWGKSPKELMERYDKTSVANFYIWATGKKCPPLKLLVDMTWETETNIEYALGLTDVIAKNDTNIVKPKVSELLKEQNDTILSFSKKIETTSLTIKRYSDGFSKMRLGTLIAMADGFNVSVDYLLGLTQYRTWSEYRRMLDPFVDALPGDALHITFPHPYEEMSGNVLMHPLGGKVLFPTGKTRSIRSELFDGVKVERLLPHET